MMMMMMMVWITNILFGIYLLDYDDSLYRREKIEMLYVDLYREYQRMTREE